MPSSKGFDYWYQGTPIVGATQATDFTKWFAGAPIIQFGRAQYVSTVTLAAVSTLTASTPAKTFSATMALAAHPTLTFSRFPLLTKSLTLHATPGLATSVQRTSQPSLALDALASLDAVTGPLHTYGTVPLDITTTFSFGPVQSYIKLDFAATAGLSLPSTLHTSGTLDLPAVADLTLHGGFSIHELLRFRVRTRFHPKYLEHISFGPVEILEGPGPGDVVPAQAFSHASVDIEVLPVEPGPADVVGPQGTQVAGTDVEVTG